ncbi:2506_t:CDS:2, partial [Dentiscutata heterogama]
IANDTSLIGLEESVSLEGILGTTPLISPIGSLDVLKVSGFPNVKTTGASASSFT